MVLCSILGAIGVPIVNGSGPVQGGGLGMNVAAGVATIPILPPQIVSEPIGNPSECLLLKNMFDPAAEVCYFLSQK